MNTKERIERREQAADESLQGQPQRTERLSTADLAHVGKPEVDASRDAATTEAQTDVAPLFPSDVVDEFRGRWADVQTGFVDTPRDAVQHADELVADAIKRLAEQFSQERARLESQWARSGDVSTEDLRIALQRYRSFFQRLLHL